MAVFHLFFAVLILLRPGAMTEQYSRIRCRLPPTPTTPPPSAAAAPLELFFLFFFILIFDTLLLLYPPIPPFFFCAYNTVYIMCVYTFILTFTYPIKSRYTLTSTGEWERQEYFMCYIRNVEPIWKESHTNTRARAFLIVHQEVQKRYKKRLESGYIAYIVDVCYAAIAIVAAFHMFSRPEIPGRHQKALFLYYSLSLFLLSTSYSFHSLYLVAVIPASSHATREDDEETKQNEKNI